MMVEPVESHRATLWEETASAGCRCRARVRGGDIGNACAHQAKNDHREQTTDQATTGQQSIDATGEEGLRQEPAHRNPTIR
jgi:hypothetical protein